MAAFSGVERYSSRWRPRFTSKLLSVSKCSVHNELSFWSQTNTYQAILITDGMESYAIFIYLCGALTWSGSATVGYNADGVLHTSFPLSGTDDVKLVSCLDFPQRSWSNLIYPLTLFSSMQLPA